MRIVEIVSGHALNGAMKHAFMLARVLSRRGHDVIVVCRQGSWIAREASRAHLDVRSSDLHRWPPDELRRIATLVSDCAADLVHTHMSRAHFFGVLLKAMVSTPVVATAHCRRIQAHWRFNDRTIAVSESVKRFHNRWNFVPRNRIDVVHNFVDLDELPPPPGDARSAARQALGLDACAPLVGIVGSVFREKGVHHAVRAMPRILNAVPAARLAIVGEGPYRYRRGLEREVERLGVGARVAWLGQRDHIAALMAAFDVLVAPSNDEALTLSVLEAMTSQVPIVASDSGGIRECVGHGATGLLVRPGDVAGLASACAAILTNPDLGRRFGSSARARVLGQFTTDTQVPKIESIFEAVIARRPALEPAAMV
jgi:glycosyltransferase involved in cell wall biosynthesis